MRKTLLVIKGPSFKLILLRTNEIIIYKPTTIHPMKEYLLRLAKCATKLKRTLNSAEAGQKKNIYKHIYIYIYYILLNIFITRHNVSGYKLNNLVIIYHNQMWNLNDRNPGAPQSILHLRSTNPYSLPWVDNCFEYSVNSDTLAALMYCLLNLAVRKK